jgi:hypothetical protein
MLSLMERACPMLRCTKLARGLYHPRGEAVYGAAAHLRARLSCAAQASMQLTKGSLHKAGKICAERYWARSRLLRRKACRPLRLSGRW